MNHTYINRIVFKHFGIKENLNTYTRLTIAVKARFAAMLLCKEELGYTLMKIKKAYNRKSHSSVHNAIVTAHNLIDTDPQYNANVSAARAEVKRTIIEFRKAKQRYNLHYRLRQKGIKVDSQERLISIETNQENLIADAQQLRSLLEKHNYLIQYSIL